MLNTNIMIAVEEITKAKAADPQIRARIETCVLKESIKLYLIVKEHIQEVITIDNGTVISRRVPKEDQHGNV